MAVVDLTVEDNKSQRKVPDLSQSSWTRLCCGWAVDKRSRIAEPIQGRPPGKAFEAGLGLPLQTDKMMTSSEGGGCGHDARPQDDELALYARAYRGVLTADELFLRFEAHAANAQLLEQTPERFDGEHGLSGRQLAEGARMAARRMAILLAEAPTSLREVLALKVHVFETMVQMPDEITRSNAAIMLEAAMKADGEMLGIVLLPLDAPFGPRQ